jgi:hypothetical protein
MQVSRIPQQDTRKGYPYIIVKFIVDFLAIIEYIAHIPLILSDIFPGRNTILWKCGFWVVRWGGWADVAYSHERVNGLNKAQTKGYLSPELQQTTAQAIALFDRAGHVSNVPLSDFLCAL